MTRRFLTKYYPKGKKGKMTVTRPQIPIPPVEPTYNNLFDIQELVASITWGWWRSEEETWTAMRRHIAGLKD